MKRVMPLLAICAILSGCYAYAPYGYSYYDPAYATQYPYSYAVPAAPYAYAAPYPYAYPYYGGYGYSPFSISGAFIFGGGHGGHGHGGWHH